MRATAAGQDPTIGLMRLENETVTIQCRKIRKC